MNWIGTDKFNVESRQNQSRMCMSTTQWHKFAWLVISMLVLFVQHGNGNEICNKSSINDTIGFSAIPVGNDIWFGTKIDCFKQQLIVSIEAPAYNWVGFVFNASMYGDAIIYTTGKYGNESLKLYDYYITSQDLDGIHKDVNQSWQLLKQITLENVTVMTYNRSINVSEYDNNDYIFKYSENDTYIITFRYIMGPNTTVLNSTDWTISEVIQIKFPQGEIIAAQTPAWVKKLHMIHGLLMWFAWAICGTLAVFCAKYRPFIQSTYVSIRRAYENCMDKRRRNQQENGNRANPRVQPVVVIDNPPMQRQPMQEAVGDLQPWFLLHRMFALLAGILNMIGFGFAVVIVDNTPTKWHFWNLHEFMGLMTTLIVFFQMLTGFCRPFTTTHDVSPLRMWFKYFHSMSGTVAWLIANLNILLGIQKMPNSNVFFTCHGAWIVMWISIFIASTINKSRSQLGIMWHGYVPERLI